MGYWAQNEHGHSFSESESGEEMVWGDAPADIIDDALHGVMERVVKVFTTDMGRPPTAAELRAGMLFSWNGRIRDYEAKQFEELMGLEIIDKAQAWTRFDAAARMLLRMSGDEFARRYDAGETDDLNHNDVERVAALRPSED